MDTTLTETEARVLACLVEKERCTPEYYPLTLRALVAAVNQRSNRDPVMDATETEVADATAELRLKELAWQVTLADSRVPKFKHNLQRFGKLTEHEQALLCELMLRGPQTVGELRGRAERICGPLSRQDAEEAVRALLAWESGALVAELPREPGTREVRFAHALCGLPAAAASPDAKPGDGAAAPLGGVVAPGAGTPRALPLSERVAVLEGEVGRLDAALRELRDAFDAFRAEFG